MLLEPNRVLALKFRALRELLVNNQKQRNGDLEREREEQTPRLVVMLGMFPLCNNNGCLKKS